MRSINKKVTRAFLQQNTETLTPKNVILFLTVSQFFLNFVFICMVSIFLM